MKILGIIPARFNSSRFPGKPLIDINGKSMIQRVYEQVTFANTLDKVVVATDDVRIQSHVNTFTDAVVMTSSHHLNGTERCNEVAAKMVDSYDFIINIQGDEPFINPLQIDQLAEIYQNKPTVQIATLIKKVDQWEVLENSSVVKVVTDINGKALYFSRSVIPFQRNRERSEWIRHTDFYKHVGIYGYTPQVLAEIVQLPPGRLEQTESLEQLRWLENGYGIYCGITPYESKSIDTPEDLADVLKNK
jgi:3-deoxy-manno-octulosonate cytidylyltransferase (CMP-KDO synthetase)